MKTLETHKKMDTTIEGRKASGKKRQNRNSCKRNKNLPHEFVKVQLHNHSKWINWTDYRCRHCGKLEYIFERPSDSFWNSEAYNKKKRAKMNIVG